VVAAPDEPVLAAVGVGASVGARCSSTDFEPKGMTGIGGPGLLAERFSSIGSMRKVEIVATGERRKESVVVPALGV